MRAFAAVGLPVFDGPLPPELRPESHLTLHFFGELSLERVPAVVEAITEVARATPPFSLEIRGVGAFPTLQRPRVIWAGVGDGSEAVRSLADRLRASLDSRGFSVEGRVFVPHVTLLRVRSPTTAHWGSQFLADPETAVRVWCRTQVSEVRLVESQLAPTGARHTVRERVPLSRLD